MSEKRKNLHEKMNILFSNSRYIQWRHSFQSNDFKSILHLNIQMNIILCIDSFLSVTYNLLPSTFDFQMAFIYRRDARRCLIKPIRDQGSPSQDNRMIWLVDSLTPIMSWHPHYSRLFLWFPFFKAVSV